MAEHDTPTALSRVQRQIDLITNTENEGLARIARHIAMGYLLELNFDRLIDNDEYRPLEDAASQILAQWMLPLGADPLLISYEENNPEEASYADDRQ